MYEKDEVCVEQSETIDCRCSMDVWEFEDEGKNNGGRAVGFMFWVYTVSEIDIPTDCVLSTH